MGWYVRICYKSIGFISQTLGLMQLSWLTRSQDRCFQLYAVAGSMEIAILGSSPGPQKNDSSTQWSCEPLLPGLSGSMPRSFR